MATKSLDSEQAERAREIFKRLLAQGYAGNQSTMAKALKVTGTPGQGTSIAGRRAYL